ncbi:MAG: alpha/beta hydrolase [Gammaproteobacteria bacterium]|nr:alpha/beta hydrolase [Gammaproteobacteria bacterium]
MSTFVLLHGAYQGGWIWQPVVRRLEQLGHIVYAPSLDGCGERSSHIRPGITVESHANEVAQLMFYEDLHDATLVGTSTGGMVLARAAELAKPRVGRVVFADALALMDGEALPDIVQRPTAVDTEIDTGPPREDVENRLFAELDPQMKAWAVARYTMHPISVMRDPVELASFWNSQWEAKVIWCKRSANPPEAHQRRAAQALNAKWYELDTGHYPMLSEPDALIKMILD